MANARLIEIQFFTPPALPVADIMFFAISLHNAWNDTIFQPLSPGGVTSGAAANTIAAGGASVIPIAGTFDQLHIDQSNNGDAAPIVYTLWVNGAPTTLQASVGPGNNRGHDTTHAVHVVLHDLVGFQLTNINAASANRCGLSVRFTPDP